MEDQSTEAWNFRIEKDDLFRREMLSIFNELRTQAKSHIHYYKHSKTNNSERFSLAFTRLYEHLQLGIETGVVKVLSIAHKFDFDPNLPSNGYRSFVRIVHKCCIHLLQLCRYISGNRGSLLFRSGHYSRELTAYVTTLGQLRACLHYLFKLLSYCEAGDLFPDDEKINPEHFKEAEVLMKEIESLSQECFYGRCLGFQYCDSMQKPLMTICLIMASFSDGYLSENTSTIMKFANSMLGGSRYFMDPELRGQKIVEVTRNCDINFCQAFWAMNENDLMHTLPLFVCPPVQLDKVIIIPPDTFEIPTTNSNETARITPPCSHTGPGPVNCRLISYELRKGQETWKAHGVVAQHTDKRKALPRSSGLLIHIHGGGFVAQSSASHEVYLRHWAKELRVPIFCVDYSLAPKHPFPRAFEETFFAYCWALKNARALGSTGERICVCGDSAGGNLAMAIAMRAATMNIRQPDGIQTTYGCLLVRYTPSPSRMMALMDPLLPLGIISRCLAAYAGMTEQTGVNAPMGAAMTKQTIFDFDEDAEMREQHSLREQQLEEQAIAFQEQALRLQQQAQQLLAETQQLRLRSSSLNAENIRNRLSKSSSQDSFPSPTKSGSFDYKSLPQASRESPAKDDKQPISARESDVDNGVSVNSDVDSSVSHVNSVGQENITNQNEVQSDLQLEEVEEDTVAEGAMDLNLRTEDANPVNCETKTGENKSEIGIENEEHKDHEVKNSCDESNACESKPLKFELSDNGDCDKSDSQSDHSSINLVNKESSCDKMHQNKPVTCDRETLNDINKATENTAENASLSSSDNPNAPNSCMESEIDSAEGIDKSQTTPKRKSPLHFGHKTTGSGDSGFHDFTTVAQANADSPESSTNVDSQPSISSQASTADITTSRDDHSSTLPTNTTDKQHCESNTTLIHEDASSNDSSTYRDKLRLDLNESAHLPRKSPSSPNLVRGRSTSDDWSTGSPVDFYTPHGSMNMPGQVFMTTPSYAKVRHIAQSPVDQLVHMPISRNPYMSPYLAEDSLLRNFPPVYFVCCELDPMLDDSVQMAKRLRDLGNEVHLDILADLPHGFLNFSLVSRDARQGSELCVRRIKQVLETDDQGIYRPDAGVDVDDFEILNVDQ